jgi:hypothetical protein
MLPAFAIAEVALVREFFASFFQERSLFPPPRTAAKTFASSSCYLGGWADFSTSRTGA